MFFSSRFWCFLSGFLCTGILWTSQASLCAWDRGTVAYGRGQIEMAPVLADSATHLLSRSENGPQLGVRLSNRQDKRIAGAFLYLGITDFTGLGLQEFRLELDLAASADTVIFCNATSIAESPGFYDMRALLFDHGRELGKLEFTFGYDTGHLDHDYQPPEDFDSFWRATLDSLASVPTASTALFDSTRSNSEVEVFRISYASLHGVRVHGWLTLPVGREGPHAGLVFYPGYSSGRIEPALDYSRRGYATVSIQVRGYEVDRESYPEDNRRYMTIGCERPETYIYRQIICHCLRAVQILADHPDVDASRLAAIGGSQGGGLSLLVAGLDPRIKAVVACVPFLTDFERSMAMTGAPYRDLVRHIEQHPGSRVAVMKTVRYFDTVSLASRIEVPVIVSAGLFDRTCPAPSIYRMFLELGSSDKRIEIYPWLDHLEVSRPFMPLARQWLAERLPAVRN
jgi:cephalosporin-C deacetylase